MNQSTSGRTPQQLIVLVVVTLLGTGLLVYFAPNPVLSSRSMVRPTVPFVLQLPSPPHTAAIIRTQGGFGIAILERANRRHTVQGSWEPIPARLQMRLTTLHATWCANLPAWPSTPTGSEEAYEVSMLCPGSTRPDTMRIAAADLPPELADLIAVVYWEE
jgi:hypothetical protein